MTCKAHVCLHPSLLPSIYMAKIYKHSYCNKVLRGVSNSEVDLNTALSGWDCRHCPHQRGVPYSECPLQTGSTVQCNEYSRSLCPLCLIHFLLKVIQFQFYPPLVSSQQIPIAQQGGSTPHCWTHPQPNTNCTLPGFSHALPRLAY